MDIAVFENEVSFLCTVHVTLCVTGMSGD